MIHPTAVIHPQAQLHPSVRVGAYAVIGEQVTIGRDTTIEAHVVIDGATNIGERNHIFPGAAIGLEPQDLKYEGAISGVSIGNDNRIREYVTINRATQGGEMTCIGDNNLLMAYVHVAHNCTIGNGVVITNAVELAGHVCVESNARIGGVVGVHQFVHIGQLSMVGGMSRIDRDVPPYMLVEGNPSRVRALNQVGLKRSGLMEVDEGQAFQALKKAFRLLYRSDLTLDRALDGLNMLPGTPEVQHLQRFLQASRQPGRRGPISGQRRHRGEAS